MDSKTLPLAECRTLFRDRLDWLLAAAIVGLMPLLFLYVWDFWLRTDFLFFPMLILASVGYVGWNARFGRHDDKWRSIFTILGIVLAGLAAVLSAVLLSPWLAVLALVLFSIGWMLERFGEKPWVSLVGWTLPMWAMLLLPLSDRTDATRSFESTVALSASNLLDVIGIPQLPTNDTLEFRSGQLSIGVIGRGIGNPYLLFSLVVLFCLFTRSSFIVGTLVVATVPVWAWLGGVLFVVIGVVLVEHYDVYVFVGYRQSLAQGIVLAVMLLSIWLLKLALQKLFTPFVAYSSQAAEWHKFFNWAVLWPAKDPLRKRRSDAVEMTANRVGNALQHRYASIALGLVAVAFVSAGIYSFYQTLVGDAFARLTTLRLPSAEVENILSKDILPADLSGMQQVAFQITPYANTGLHRAYAAHWTYLRGAKRLEITAILPYRGYYEAENDFLSDESKLIKPRQSFELSGEEANDAALFDEVEISDPLFGLSYLAYGNFAMAGRLDRKSTESGIANSLKLQPTVVNVRLFVEGAGSLEEDEREVYQQTISSACAQLQQRVQESLVRGNRGDAGGY